MASSFSSYSYYHYSNYKSYCHFLVPIIQKSLELEPCPGLYRDSFYNILHED